MSNHPRLTAACSLVGAVAATTAFVTMVALPATGAFASSLPGNCAATHDTGTTSSTGHLISSAYGHCYDTSNHNIVARVYIDKPSAPDPQVGHGSSSSAPGYDHRTTDDECNAGQTNIYYGMSLWYNDLDHNNQSAHTRQHAC